MSVSVGKVEKETAWKLAPAEANKYLNKNHVLSSSEVIINNLNSVLQI